MSDDGNADKTNVRLGEEKSDRSGGARVSSTFRNGDQQQHEDDDNPSCLVPRSTDAGSTTPVIRPAPLVGQLHKDLSCEANKFRSNVEGIEKPRQIVILVATIAGANYLVSENVG